MRILLVDDHLELLSEIEKFLLTQGHEVATAASAEVAIQIVDSDRDFHVVITDIAMPGMNGIQMWDKICPLLPETKVIFISSTNNSFLQRYLPGAFMPKPFRLEHLQDCILQLETAAA